jgi:hypothetical protein
MDVWDDPDRYPDSDVAQVAEKLFQDHYLRPLGDDVKYVRLESEFRVCEVRRSHTDVLRQKCTRKIAAAIVLLRGQLKH